MACSGCGVRADLASLTLHFRLSASCSTIPAALNTMEAAHSHHCNTIEEHIRCSNFLSCAGCALRCTHGVCARGHIPGPFHGQSHSSSSLASPLRQCFCFHINPPSTPYFLVLFFLFDHSFRSGPFCLLRKPSMLPGVVWPLPSRRCTGWNWIHYFFFLSPSACQRQEYRPSCSTSTLKSSMPESLFNGRQM